MSAKATQKFARDKRRARLRAADLCIDCGKREVEAGHSLCSKCLLARRVRERLRYSDPNRIPIPIPPRNCAPGCCDICLKPVSPEDTQRDHCHKTNSFRGWLCRQCNLGLGMFRDSPDLLQRSINYLTLTSEVPIMARIRAIKHDYFTNDDLAQVSFPARLLGIGLTTIADREGRLLDRPLRIAAQILPYDSVDCDTLLGELESAQYIQRYSIDTVKYIQIINFRKHQMPHPNEKPSTIPSLEPCAEICEQPVNHEKERTAHAVNGLMGNGSLVIGNGKRVTERQPKPRRADTFSIPPDSILKLDDEDRLWAEQYAPNVPDLERATLKWFAKQQANPGRGKDVEAWKASWRGYMMNYSDGETNRNGNGNGRFQKTTTSGGNGNGSTAGVGSEINTSLPGRIKRAF